MKGQSELREVNKKHLNFLAQPEFPLPPLPAFLKSVINSGKEDCWCLSPCKARDNKALVLVGHHCANTAQVWTQHCVNPAVSITDYRSSIHQHWNSPAAGL